MSPLCPDPHCPPPPAQRRPPCSAPGAGPCQRRAPPPPPLPLRARRRAEGRRRQRARSVRLGPARPGSVLVLVRGSAPAAGPCPSASRRRERPPARLAPCARRPPRWEYRRAGGSGGGRGCEGAPPRVADGPGGGWECGHECRNDCEPSRYLHQDGRVVKALDLRSNGRMSAWVRTPLLQVKLMKMS
uniref:translation initiation factor IF-2-like n=1 Tax=Agelaius phoeniceus TaxID=39638 RepID=UPI0023ED53DA|nr:translation initiation factor IF-2-like [Agelaius phoeniceus]